MELLAMALFFLCFGAICISLTIMIFSLTISAIVQAKLDLVRHKKIKSK